MIVLPTPFSFGALRPLQQTPPTNFSAPIHKKSQNVRHSQLRLFDFQKNRNTSKKIIKKIETL